MTINQDLFQQNMDLFELAQYFGIEVVDDWPDDAEPVGYSPTEWAQIIGPRKIFFKSPMSDRGLRIEQLNKYMNKAAEALLHEICHILVKPNNPDISDAELYDVNEWETGLPPLQFALATFALEPELGEICQKETELAYSDDGGRLGVPWAEATIKAYELGMIDMDGYPLLTKPLSEM